MRSIAATMLVVDLVSRAMSAAPSCGRRERGRIALEHREHGHLLVEDAGLGGRHLRARVGAVDDEPFGLEPADRLADRERGDPELLGQRVDHDAVARAVRAAEDPLADRAVDALLLGEVLGLWCGGHVWAVPTLPRPGGVRRVCPRKTQPRISGGWSRSPASASRRPNSAGSAAPPIWWRAIQTPRQKWCPTPNATVRCFGRRDVEAVRVAPSGARRGSRRRRAARAARPARASCPPAARGLATWRGNIASGDIQRSASSVTADHRRVGSAMPRASGWVSSAQIAKPSPSRGSLRPPPIISLVFATISSRVSGRRRRRRDHRADHRVVGRRRARARSPRRWPRRPAPAASSPTAHTSGSSA